jgi:hypothetical protein
MKRRVVQLLAILTLVACFPEEQSYAPQKLTNLVGEANLLSDNQADYQQQVFYSLRENSVRASMHRDEWDLAISCRPGQPNLFVNSVKSMSVAATNDFVAKKNYEPDDYQFQFERSDRFFRKAIMGSDFVGNKPKGQVYLIDLGRRLNNTSRGYKVFQVLDYWDGGKYRFYIADIDGANADTLQFDTDPKYAHLYLSFDELIELKALEPPLEEWDLVFTRYMERLFDGQDTLDYSVVGVLINPWMGEAARWVDSSKTFDQIGTEDLLLHDFSRRQDLIGHDWKSFDIEAGVFSILPYHYFAYRSREELYKLQFTGFYGEKGQKGVIGFEYLGY